ncbi:hypothetical protein CPB83DRAFT_909721 [Crepidotus variabilis]|uniref:Uncharacterized protein n=1 Tax=Crepidotus variabilis TaxID=179855 RepID=A0A9P6E8Y0_9AGAR|nr:hypothetical protein CPB83DRAFT_909721 [Crepidotus variabilis]
MSTNKSTDNIALLRQLEDRELYIAKCISRIDQKDKLILELKERLELANKENKKLHEIIILHHREPSASTSSAQRVKIAMPNTSSKPSQENPFQSRGLKPSLADLRAKLYEINKDISQAAATLGKGLVYHHYTPSADRWEIMKEKVERRIGRGMLSILKEGAAKANLRTIDINDINDVNLSIPVHSLLAQVTIQVFLAETVAYEMFVWSPQPEKIELSRELSRIYIGLQAAENHSTCTHWRALTSSQIPLTSDPTQWKEAFKRKLSYLFHIASWRALDNAQLESFYRALDPIYTTLRYIRTSLWGISEEEYEICFIKAGTSFDPAKMNEIYAGKETRAQKGGAVVLGTTSIGLCKVITDKSGFATESVKLVAAPDVVIESSLRAVLSLGLGELHSDGRD